MGQHPAVSIIIIGRFRPFWNEKKSSTFTHITIFYHSIVPIDWTELGESSARRWDESSRADDEGANLFPFNFSSLPLKSRGKRAGQELTFFVVVAFFPFDIHSTFRWNVFNLFNRDERLKLSTNKMKMNMKKPILSDDTSKWHEKSKLNWSMMHWTNIRPPNTYSSHVPDRTADLSFLIPAVQKDWNQASELSFYTVIYAIQWKKVSLDSAGSSLLSGQSEKIVI